MKTYHEYITEQQMSVQDAQSLLGLGGRSYTQDELKAAYKKLAGIHHPDRGGDVVQMQRINAAYDKLSKIMLGGSHQSPEDRTAAYKHSKEQDRIFLVAAIGKVKQHVDIHRFTSHFQAIFGEHFSCQEHDSSGEIYAYRGAISFEFSNSARTTVLTLAVSISASERHNRGLSAPDQGLNMYVSTSILHNRRKIKLGQTNYSFESGFQVLTNPELLFPAKKLQGKMAGKVTKFTRKDAILALTKETKGEFHDNWLTIPLPHTDNLNIKMYRSVFMGHASWSLEGVYQKYKPIERISSVSRFYETAGTIGWLIDHIKVIQGLHSTQDVTNHLKSLMQQYKANLAEIDPESAKS